MTTEITMPSYILPEVLLILMFLMIAASAIMPGIDRWSRRFFIVFFSVSSLGVAVFTFDIMTYDIPEMIWLENVLPLTEYMMFPLPSIIFTINLVHHVEEDWRKSIFLRIILLLWGFYCILHVIAHFTHYFYYSTPDRRFILRPAHPLLFVPVIAILAINIVMVIIKRNKLTRRHFWASLIYLIPAFISTIIHSLFFTIILINIALFISSLAMYIIILAEQIDQYMRQKTAIANQDASIMILQMRPHFIYDTMTSIYYLCEQDPKKAQQVILDLTSYLRKNFNAMGSSNIIPFSAELEHIRAYLAVELAQNEDHLFVEYDIPHTRFRLPPLTLQPLVENAVKHGLDPESEPLHILIRTRETEAGSVILVEDNGPGFDPRDVFDSHNALSNIKQRLKMMCKGSITITSKSGEGTVVKIVIPENE
ncbi:MAG: histidine kinase [Lachnospiraceae bacterium]|nr:histidine kinase [Lachnospiraceae bacterium]